MNTQTISLSGMLAVALLLLNAVILETAVVRHNDWLKALWITLPLLAFTLYRSKRKTGK